MSKLPEFTAPPQPMTCDPNEEITPDLIEKFIEIHKLECTRYKKLMDMYIGNHAIYTQKAKEDGKPDNRVVMNMPKYITDTFMGFFNGIPIKKKHPKDKVYKAIAEFDDLNDVENEEYELAKKACIQGRAYEYMYQDEETKTCITYFTAEEMFLVYDNTVKQRPFFAVRYSETDEEFIGELISMEGYFPLSKNEEGKLIIDKTDNNKKMPFPYLPISEWVHNEERMSIFESVITLIDSLNKTMSEKANDIEFFADAILAIIGAKLGKDKAVIDRDKRVINLYNLETGLQTGTLDVKFLEKPNADETQEHYLDRIERYIYQISMVANISDENFGASSGTALAYKLQSMSNLALNMQRKVVKALDYRYMNFCGLTTNVTADKKDSWKDIEYSFTRNMPKNVLEESQIMQNVDGHVSDETKLSVFSKIDDPKKELERMAEEEKAQPRVMDLVDLINQNSKTKKEDEDKQQVAGDNDE